MSSNRRSPEQVPAPAPPAPAPVPGWSRRHVLTAGVLAAAAAAAPWSVPTAHAAPALEDGSRLWLRYPEVGDPRRLRRCREALRRVAVVGDGDVLANAGDELARAIEGLTGVVPERGWSTERGTVVLGTLDRAEVRDAIEEEVAERLGEQGFAIRALRSGRALRRVVVAGHTPTAVLHGAFHLIRALQGGADPGELSTVQVPATSLRMLNHWDNLDGSIERGYAGRSIFDWDELPEVSGRMVDYARATASIGVNASVLNNVNANADLIDAPMLAALAPLCAMLASWGIRPWLSLNYASPITLTAGTADPITTADPEDPRVQRWWQDKIEEIVAAIPDLGGFLVKANSEGQPGPLDYGRTHADGANMLARAIAPHDGLIVWRSFVHEDFGDWAEYQHRIFAPLDGDFDDNVIVQTKYGPIDFQVREPVHPLFGTLTETHQMLELQITQEYTGHATHSVYLAPMWREVLDFPTGGPQTGPTVAEIVGGPRAGIAGVSNYGDDTDWTGYQLGAANSYAFGRLAWDPTADPAAIATEWVRMTFGLDGDLVATVVAVLMASWETYEDYTSPLGLGYLTNPGGDHLGPDPWGTITQSHHSSPLGTGFDRTTVTGSGFTGLYPPAWAELYEDVATAPEELLLFLHWVPYEHRLSSGRTVIQHIYDTHFEGVDAVRGFQRDWEGLRHLVDADRHADVAATFEAHLDHAITWRDAIVSFYFELSRVLDERREWLQVDAPGLTVLSGGRANRVPVDVTNAGADAERFGAALRAADWEVEQVDVEVPATETVAVPVVVTPPSIGAAGTATLELDTSLPVLGGREVRYLVAPDGGRCHLALDAGTADSPLQPGYQRLTPTTTWTAERGYGWVAGPTPNGRDRNQLEPLTADLVGHPQPATLRIPVPPGTHTAQLLVGDRGARAQPAVIAIDGSEVARTPDLTSGSFAWVDLEIDGGASGGSVDLELSGTSDWWKVAALVVVDPEAPVPPLHVLDARTEAPVWWTGATEDVVVTVASTGDDAQVTVEVEVPEGWSSAATTVTIAAETEQEVRVPVTAGVDPAIERLAVVVADATGEVERGRLVEVVVAPDPGGAALALDAGPVGSTVVDGYAALTPADRWDAERGFGWRGDRPDSRDRHTSDDLRRDVVMHKDQRTLDLAVPAGPHTVWVLTGDAATDSAITIVSEGGVELGRTGPSTLPSRVMRWFSFPLDGGTSGRTASLDLTGSGLNRMWRVVALVVRPD